jgi:Uma2 family endonuclease
MTVEEFARMQTSDTENYELVGGELVPLPGKTIRHARIRDLMGHLLWSYFRQNPIGETVGELDCRINPEEVRRPDLSMFLNDRMGRMDLDKIPAPSAPDIAIEVLSPSESAVDLRHKVRDYLKGGSSEVWLIDHSNGEVLVNTAEGIRVLQESDILESPLLPGFKAKVADLLSA